MEPSDQLRSGNGAKVVVVEITGLDRIWNDDELGVRLCTSVGGEFLIMAGAGAVVPATLDTLFECADPTDPVELIEPTVQREPIDPVEAAVSIEPSELVRIG